MTGAGVAGCRVLFNVRRTDLGSGVIRRAEGADGGARLLTWTRILRMRLGSVSAPTRTTLGVVHLIVVTPGALWVMRNWSQVRFARRPVVVPI